MASHEGKPADAALPSPPPPYHPPAPTRDSIAAAVARLHQELAEQARPLIEDVMNRFTEQLVIAVVSGRTRVDLDLDIGALWDRHKIPRPFDLRLAVSILREAFKDSDYYIIVSTTNTAIDSARITLMCQIPTTDDD